MNNPRTLFRTIPERSGRRSLVAAGVVAAMFATSLPLWAAIDTYTCIISGDPVAASTADSCAVASAGTSLETGARTGWSVAPTLEARYRTWDESNASALRSDKRRGFPIIFR